MLSQWFPLEQPAVIRLKRHIFPLTQENSCGVTLATEGPPFSATKAGQGPHCRSIGPLRRVLFLAAFTGAGGHSGAGGHPTTL